MYSQDSFFDLTPVGQVGLICLSAALGALTVLAARRLLGRRAVGARIAGALALFWLFVWISPQGYYQYYRLLIADLPLQWVIWPPPPPNEPLLMLVFQGPQTLSAHSQGVLGWLLIAAPFVRLPTFRRPPDD